MMSSNRLYQHYRQQLALFREHFDNTHERLEVEDIHQIRVSIKKIRTNLTLINIVSKGEFNNTSHFKLLSKLFKNAGKLREIQINLAILDKIILEKQHIDELCQSAFNSYRNNLMQQGQKSIHRLKKTLNTFNFKKLKKCNQILKESIAQLDDEIVIEQSNSFVEKQIDKINTLRIQIDDRELHKIRKHLKSITAIYRLNIEIFPNNLLQQKIERFKGLETLIGDWHDLMMLISSMENYICSEEGIEFEPPLRKVVNELSSRGREIKGEVITHLEDTLAH